jgi:hypothetical protein
MMMRCRSNKATPQGWGMTEYLRGLRVGQSFIFKGKRNGLYAQAKLARVRIKTRRLLPDTLLGITRYEVWRIR